MTGIRKDSVRKGHTPRAASQQHLTFMRRGTSRPSDRGSTAQHNTAHTCHNQHRVGTQPQHSAAAQCTWSRECTGDETCLLDTKLLSSRYVLAPVRHIHTARLSSSARFSEPQPTMLFSHSEEEDWAIATVTVTLFPTVSIRLLAP
jgi:hypothetical protein